MPITVVILAAALFQAARFFYPLRYDNIVSEQAKQHKLDPSLLAAIVYEESKFDRQSLSPAGAVGLMQVMPETAGWASRRMGRPGLADRLADPGANLAIGSWYFRYLLNHYKSIAFALAAYNGGQRNLEKWLAKNDGLDQDEVVKKIPFPETRQFVQRVQRSQLVYRWLYPELRR